MLINFVVCKGRNYVRNILAEVRGIHSVTQHEERKWSAIVGRVLDLKQVPSHYSTTYQKTLDKSLNLFEPHDVQE